MKKILIIVLILFIVSGCKDNKVEKKATMKKQILKKQVNIQNH